MKSGTVKQKNIHTKKIYHSPKLKVVGSVSQFTQAARNQGVKDNGSGLYHAS
jgi:HJR/Mrr/RecB family endonuclease